MVITPIDYNAVCPVCDSYKAYETKNADGTSRLECQKCGFIEITEKNGKRKIKNLGRKVTKSFNVNVSFKVEADNEEELIKFINENIKVENKEVSYKEEEK